MRFDVENNGLKASYPTDGSCTLDSMTIPGKPGIYDAIQFHIHLSSEHTIDGSNFGAELHIVHLLRSTTITRAAVLGVILEPTASQNNGSFEKVLSRFELSKQSTESMCGIDLSRALPLDFLSNLRERFAAFHAYSMLEPDCGFYHYDGSLTTPPCSEIVWWNLADKRLPISVRQFNRMVNLVLEARNERCEFMTIADPRTGSTSRPPVPLGNRWLKRVCPTSSLR